MKLTKKEVELIEKSINHWLVDIIYPFIIVPGERKIIKCPTQTEWLEREENGGKWKKTGEKVKCYSDDCPLCLYFMDDGSENGCEACPYFRFYEKRCVDRGMAWNNFIKKLSYESAKEMVESLRRIIKESEIADY